MSITPVRIRASQSVPDVLPDTVASRRLRDLERGAEWAETAVDVGNTLSSFNPILPTTLDLDPSVNESLEQIGESNWYGPPAEGADPRNCELWPNSPYCGGSVVDLLEAREVGLVGQVNLSPCETCIQINPKIFGISGPSGIYCRRSSHPDCQAPLNPPSPEPEEFEGLAMEYVRPLKRNNYTRAVVSVGFVAEIEYPLIIGGSFNPSSAGYEEWRQFYLSVRSASIKAVPGGYFEIPRNNRRHDSPWTRDNEPKWDKVSQANFRFNQVFMTQNPDFEDGEAATWAGSNGTSVTYLMRKKRQLYNFVFFQDFNCDQRSANESINLLIERVKSAFGPSYYAQYVGILDNQTDVGQTSPAYGYLDFFDGSPPLALYQVSTDCADPAPVRPPANQPLPRPDMSCCDETLELLEAIYARLGVDEFPVKAPPLLIQEDEKEIALENHAQLWEWTARNLDAVMGQFPIKIKVKDSDPTKEGNQEVELNLPNVAETLAELFGLVYQSEINTDLITEILLRLIPEVISTKNAALIGQSYSKANASFLGYKANAKEASIDYNFDLEESQSLPRFLRESKKRITVYEDASQESVLDILAKLEFAAGIIKSSFYMKPSESNRLLGAIETMIQDEALSIPNKEQWRDWLQRMNRDSGKHNRGQSIQPEVIEDLHEGFDRL